MKKFRSNKYSALFTVSVRCGRGCVEKEEEGEEEGEMGVDNRTEEEGEEEEGM